ncbi:MAG: hypothetical protein IPQ01_08630 [Zoogloea sp.]|nr:hypothetical protein [Zoogloea sp.]
MRAKPASAAAWKLELSALTADYAGVGLLRGRQAFLDTRSSLHHHAAAVLVLGHPAGQQGDLRVSPLNTVPTNVFAAVIPFYTHVCV